MIDDVDYLYENSEKDNNIIFVDSEKRDYTIWPTPSEYSITLDQPFRNVFSVEIIDASITTTMYNVDIYQNDLWVTTVKIQPNSTIDPIPYINELSTSVYFAELFDSATQNYLLIASENQVSSYDINNINYTNSNTDYRLGIRYSISNIPIVKQTNQSSDEYIFFNYQSKKYAIKNIPSNAAIIEIINEQNYNMILNTNNEYDIVYYKYKFISPTIFSVIETTSSYWVKISNYRATLDIGNYDIASFRFALNDLLNDATNVFITPSGLTDTLKAQFIYSSVDLLLINGKPNKLDNILGFNLLPVNTATSYTSIKIGTNYNVFMGSFDVVDQVYSLTSPGMVNLGGYRYLILRCPEIEDYLYASHAYTKNSLGIGMFKLAASKYEITNLRWDFVTLIKKPIHPISKLTKLTFRFEIPDGRLYDFKGLNHQFMIAIKFYSPTRKEKFKKSILNPNYNGNLIEYIANNKVIKDKETSDNEADYDNDKDYTYYKKELDKFGYSSSEADEED
jgi:hypothetical protein